MVSIWSEMLPDVHLIFNGVDDALPGDTGDSDWPEYTSVMFDVLKPPNFFMKNGVQSHQFMVNFELEQYHGIGNLSRTPFFLEDGTPTFIRTRGECSNGSPDKQPGKGFWQNPIWNLISMITWDITFGLDMLNPNPQIWSNENGEKIKGWSPALWTAFMHYRTYAGQKWAPDAPGAWALLRDAIDHGDHTRFPNETYGAAELHNVDRLRKIVKEFASRGAAVDDEASATASRHNSRNREGLNDAGFHIWPSNYGQWLEQIDPLTTSLGRWRVGSSAGVLGRWARQTSASTGPTMTFRFDENLKFGGSGATAYVRIGVFDEGRGSWGLRYAKANGGSAVAFTMQKSNTGSWIEVRTNITDLGCCGKATATLPRGGQLELFDSDAGVNGADGDTDPDTFGWIEVQRQPYLFSLTEHVVEVKASGQLLV